MSKINSTDLTADDSIRDDIFKFMSEENSHNQAPTSDNKVPLLDDIMLQTNHIEPQKSSRVSKKINNEREMLEQQLTQAKNEKKKLEEEKEKKSLFDEKKSKHKKHEHHHSHLDNPKIEEKPNPIVNVEKTPPTDNQNTEKQSIDSLKESIEDIKPIEKEIIESVKKEVIKPIPESKIMKKTEESSKSSMGSSKSSVEEKNPPPLQNNSPVKVTITESIPQNFSSQWKSNEKMTLSTNYSNQDRNVELIHTHPQFPDDNDDAKTRNPEDPLEDTLRIKEYNLDDINPKTIDSPFGDRICILGPPGSGKSWINLDIAYHKQHIIPACHICSGSEPSNNFYADYFPGVFIKRDAQPSEIIKVRDRHTLMIQHNMSNQWLLQIRDDVAYDKKTLNDNIYNQLYKNGRHWKLLDLFAMQEPLDMPSSQRSEVTGSFIFSLSSKEVKTKAHKTFGSTLSYPIFSDALDVVTQDHTALVIRYDVQSAKLEDKLAWYKVDLPYLKSLNIKFGCDMAHHFSDQRFDKNKFL